MEWEVSGVATTMLVRDGELLTTHDLRADGGGAEWSGVGSGEPGMDSLVRSPVAEVQKLRAAEDVTEAGQEEVNGVATTHYRGTYSTVDGFAEVEDEFDPGAAREAGIDAEAAFDVFIDDEGWPRRVEVVVNEGAFETTIDFRSFNEPVDIDWPDEDQIEAPGGAVEDTQDPTDS